jgi:signal transduction histidine kinase
VRSENCGTHVHLLVRDTGHGMSAAAKRHAFDSFFTTKPEGKGTGLGLTLCQMIVTAHRGEIAIDSDVGRGAAIHVSLPVPGQADTVAS